MEQHKKTFLRSNPAIAAITGVLLMMIFATLVISLHYSPEGQILTLNDGWTITYNDNVLAHHTISGLLQEIGHSNLSANHIRISRTLPQIACEDSSPTLKLDVHYFAAEVLLENRKLAEFEMDRLRAGRFLNSQYYFVTLPQDYAGKELTLNLFFDRSSADFALVAPELGPYNDLLRLFLWENAFGLFSGIFLIVFGIYFLIVSLFFSALIPEIKGQIVSAVLSLDMGVWILTMFRLTSLFMATHVTTLIEFTTYYLFVPLLYLLLWQIHDIRNKRLYRILAIGTSVILASMVLLHLFHILHITRLRVIYYVLCIVMMSVLLMYDVSDIRHRNTGLLNVLQMTGPTVFTVFAFAAGMQYIFTGYFRGEQPGMINRMLYTAGGLLFVLTRFMIYLFLLVERQGKRLEFESLTRIADVDPLTGLYNRNYFTDTLSQLTAGKKDYCIVSLDLNHLKYVNDTFGHGKGDMLIMSFAEILRNAFPESAACCRVGGDEFIAALEGRSEEQVASYIEKTETAFTALNKTEPMIPHSVASGCAFRHEMEEEGAEAHAVYMLADQRMYEKKKAQKEKEGFSRARISEEPVPEPSPELFEKTEQNGEALLDENRKRRLDAFFTAIASASEGATVFLCDIRYDYSRWSKTAVDYFGLPGEYMFGAGRIWEAHIHPSDREAYQHSIEAVFGGERDSHDMQYRALSRDGKYVSVTCRGVVIKDATGSPEFFAGAIHNHGMQSHIDPVTGLRNQYGFTDDIADYLKKRMECRILLIGIAQFSQINDVYGYTYGSRVLQRVGRIVAESAGNTGAIYRMDGARFAIVSRDNTPDEMEKCYKKVQFQVKDDDFYVDGERQSLVLNGGLLNLEDFRVSVTTVASCLSYAINESAKRKNGELVMFRNEFTDENRKSLEMLNVIRSRISEDFRGFYLCYQYLVDARTEAVTGAEALLRWKDDFYGNVPPGKFVPVLEQDPLFPELGAWILETAMRDGLRFIEKYPDFVMNVNLSYSQLEKLDFVSMVSDMIDATGFPAEQLCLEVTESCRVLDTTMLADIISSLKSLGVRFALDDFGTGFSSLSVLRQIPFDVVKIDRQFIQDIENSEQPENTIRAITLLASNYGAEVCVEGVETEEARDRLRAHPVKTFQGFLYARPKPVEELL